MTKLVAQTAVSSAMTVALLGSASVASAQVSAPAVEVSVGYAGVVDDATVDHFLTGAAARFPLTPRLSIGPEVVYLVGPRSDRDLMVTGNLTFDLADARRRPRPLLPYLVAGGGLFRHTDRFATGTFSSQEGALTGGVGARVRLGRAYVAPEFRLGWEPHYRLSVTLGYDLGQ